MNRMHSDDMIHKYDNKLQRACSDEIQQISDINHQQNSNNISNERYSKHNQMNE